MIFYEKKECRHPPASLFTKLKTKLKFMMDYEFSDKITSSKVITLGLFALTTLLLFD